MKFHERVAHESKSDFLKFHGPSVEHDWEKVTAFSRLLADIPNAHTAQPLNWDKANQRISYERLEHLTPLLRQRRGALRLSLQQVGLTLARLHEKGHTCSALQTVTDKSIFPLQRFVETADGNRRLANKLPTGFFHGDCWHGNILLDQSGKCVLLDPIQRRWLFGQKQYVLANGSVDLATLHMSLMVSHSILRLLRLRYDQMFSIGESLVDSYLRHFRAEDLKADIMALSKRIARRYVSTHPQRTNPLLAWAKIAVTNSKMVSMSKPWGS